MIEQGGEKGERRVYRVIELTRRIKATLEGAVGEVWVEGELSNVRLPASGHCYFTIKDAEAQLSAVLFRGSRRGMSFVPADGMQVRAFGEITVYERYGNYQIIVRRMEEAGQGALQRQFEELKKRLQAEGLFDPARKRPLPPLPRHVGVVTSATGAAIRDILNVVTRRFPNLHVVIAPTKVQGADAPAEIAAAIDLLNARGGVDVMIVGRGGGSFEDLFCFNDERVARAIARSAIPVISAVGHEVDFTISDFVADLRAPTPSAAAELVVERKDAFEEHLRGAERQLSRTLRQAAQSARQRLRVIEGSYVFREPGNLAVRYRQQLEAAGIRMRHALIGRLREGHQRLDACRLRLEHETRGTLSQCRGTLDGYAVKMQHAVAWSRGNAGQELHRLQTQLRALDPLAVLKRGYSITTDADGRALTDAGDAAPGGRVTTRLHRGRLVSTVESVDAES